VLASRRHCNNVEGRKYVSDVLMDFLEEMLRQNVGRASDCF
jgi:hypothetical protein